MNLEVPYAGLLIQLMKSDGSMLVHCNQADLITIEFAKSDGMITAWCPDYTYPLEFQVKLTDKGKNFAEPLVLVHNL